ncbi:hypothetical protein ABEB36_005887, partial [Hypothenemus hampei]
QDANLRDKQVYSVHYIVDLHPGRGNNSSLEPDYNFSFLVGKEQQQHQQQQQQNFWKTIRKKRQKGKTAVA